MPRLLEFWELREHGVPFTRMHVYRLEKQNRFPKRVQIGDHRVGWVEQEIDDHVAEKIKARSTSVGTIGSRSSVKSAGAKPPRRID